MASLLCRISGRLFPQRWAAGGQPLLTGAGGWSTLIEIGNQVSNIKNVAETIAIGIAIAESVWYRCRTAFVEICDQVCDVKDIDKSIAVDVTRFAVTNLDG